MGRTGLVTIGLRAAIGYLKDNRLLPNGFDEGWADDPKEHKQLFMQLYRESK